MTKYTRPNYNSQSYAVWRSYIDTGMSIFERTSGKFFVAYEQDTPNMTVQLAAGEIWTGTDLVQVAIQDTSTITAPSANSRIDRVVVDSSSGGAVIITGTSATTPTAPAFSSGYFPVCQILLTSSSTAIVDSMITDERVAFVQATGGTINNGSWAGTDLAIVNGGTGASTAASARANLGLGIGTDVQAYDADLAAIAGLTSAANKVPYFTGSGTAGVLDFLDQDDFSSDSDTAVASQQSIKAYVDAAVAGGGGGSFSPTITSVGDNEVLQYSTASAAWINQTLSEAGISAVGHTHTLSDITDSGTLAALSSINDGNWSGTDLAVANGGTGGSTAASARANLGLVIGTDVQAQDAELSAIAGLTSAANKIPYFTGSGTAGVLDLKDEDDMASDSATSVPTQQSVKAYVDANVGGGGGGGMWSYVDSAIITSATSSIEFTGLTATAYRIEIVHIFPETDGASLRLTASNNNGSSYASADYQYVATYSSALNGNYGDDDDENASYLPIINLGIGTGAPGSGEGEFGAAASLVLWNTSDTSNPMFYEASTVSQNSSAGYLYRYYVTGVTADDLDGGSTLGVNAVKIAFSTGNIALSKVYLYKLVTS